MDNRFLNKVLDQIVRETIVGYKIRYRDYVLTSPFFLPLFHPQYPLTFSHSPKIFTNHCKNVYGLNKEETDYVWNEYKDIIKDKINNGL